MFFGFVTWPPFYSTTTQYKMTSCRSVSSVASMIGSRHIGQVVDSPLGEFCNGHILLTRGVVAMTIMAYVSNDGKNTVRTHSSSVAVFLIFSGTVRRDMPRYNSVYV